MNWTHKQISDSWTNYLVQIVNHINQLIKKNQFKNNDLFTDPVKWFNDMFIEPEYSHSNKFIWKITVAYLLNNVNK